MPGGISHAFFDFFWPLSLISSRWACEVEPQAPVWVGCSKPVCFTRFWAGSGCGGLAGTRAWGALEASPEAFGGLSGPFGCPPGPPRRTTEEAQAAPGKLRRPLGVFLGLWASRGQPLGGSGGLRGLKASPDVLSRLLSFAMSRMLAKLSLLTCFPFQLFQVPLLWTVFVG